MKTTTELSVVAFDTPQKWEAWLAKNHATLPGVWLRFYKKGSGVKTIVYAEALDVALCYGWIDSLVHKYDDKSYLQKFTPRGPRSVWSKKNTEHIERLIGEGKMKQAGMDQVERAKKDGRWEKAYASPKNVIMPKDFEDALSKNKKAKMFFQTLNRANYYGIITRISFAKKEETRAKRIKQFIEMLERGEKLH